MCAICKWIQDYNLEGIELENFYDRIIYIQCELTS